ncbi:hypothetical protein MRX96_057446 [Rhipicephalus microplus]
MRGPHVRHVRQPELRGEREGSVAAQQQLGICSAVQREGRPRWQCSAASGVRLRRRRRRQVTSGLKTEPGLLPPASPPNSGTPTARISRTNPPAEFRPRVSLPQPRGFLRDRPADRGRNGATGAVAPSAGRLCVDSSRCTVLRCFQFAPHTTTHAVNPSRCPHVGISYGGVLKPLHRSDLG